MVNDGSRIEVPQDKLYEVRLKLATEGLPKGEGVGFEIFDETSFGATDFVQKLNFIRALQGEMARTITGLSEVSRARVHIVIPKEELFIEKQKPVTASVVIKYAPFKSLKKNQIRGIVYLLASSVEGLLAKNVHIIDNHGNILSTELDGEDSVVLSASQVDLQRKVEKALMEKAQTLLDKVVGIGRSIVRISVELNFDKKETQTETFQPEGTIRSEQISKEKYQGKDVTPQGIPGVASNVPGYQAQDGSQGRESTMQKDNNTINYEISKKVEHQTDTVGNIKKISISVVMDGKHEMEEGERVYTPLSFEEIKKFTSIIKSSVGFDEARGDQIDLQNIPFDTSMQDIQMAEMADWEKSLLRDRIVKYGIYFLTMLLALGTIIYLLKPEEVEEVVEMTPEQEAFTSLLTEAETDMATERRKRERVEEEVFKLARESPEDVAKVLRVWLASAD